MTNRLLFTAIALISITGSSALAAQEIKLPNGESVVIPPRSGDSTLGGLTGRPPGPGVQKATATVNLPNGVHIVLEGDNCTTDGNTVGCSDE